MSTGLAIYCPDDGTFELSGKLSLLTIPEGEEDLGMPIAFALAAYERGRFSFQEAWDHIRNSHIEMGFVYDRS